MANDMVDEMDAMLLSLIEKEIPDGRKALVDSHKNLSVLSNYCKENYFNRSADFYFFIFFFLTVSGCCIMQRISKATLNFQGSNFGRRSCVIVILF